MAVFRVRLCPQGQPQRMNYSDVFGLANALRLVFDTTALRSLSRPPPLFAP